VATGIGKNTEYTRKIN